MIFDRNQLENSRKSPYFSVRNDDLQKNMERAYCLSYDGKLIAALRHPRLMRVYYFSPKPMMGGYVAWWWTHQPLHDQDAFTGPFFTLRGATEAMAETESKLISAIELRERAYGHPILPELRPKPVIQWQEHPMTAIACDVTHEESKSQP